MCCLHRKGDENSGGQRRPVLLLPGGLLILFDWQPIQDGYRYNVTSAMTVELLKDLLASAEGKELPQQQGKFFFAHSETFLPLLVALGIAKDEVWMNEQLEYCFVQVINPCLCPDYSLRSLWRTCQLRGSGEPPSLEVGSNPDEKISNFLFSGESSNLAMVVHKCEGSPLPKLQFFLNERPVDLDGCPNGSCNSAQFLNGHAIKGIDGRTFEEVCKPQKQGDSSSLTALLPLPRTELVLAQGLSRTLQTIQHMLQQF